MNLIRMHDEKSYGCIEHLYAPGAKKALCGLVLFYNPDAPENRVKWVKRAGFHYNQTRFKLCQNDRTVVALCDGCADQLEAIRRWDEPKIKNRP